MNGHPNHPMLVDIEIKTHIRQTGCSTNANTTNGPAHCTSIIQISFLKKSLKIDSE